MKWSAVLKSIVLCAAFAMVLVIFVTPFLALTTHFFSSDSWRVWRDYSRLLSLLQNTVSLTLLTLVLTLPAGTILALLLYSSDLLGRTILRNVFLAGLFIPLTLFAIAWQSIAGDASEPWTRGIFACAWIHSLAALPWVIFLVGSSLVRIQSDLVEDASTASGLVGIFRVVVLPGIRSSLAFASLWVVIQTFGEIVVTDMLLVRTFSEEVLTQFVAGGTEGVGRSLLLSAPMNLLAIVAAILILLRHHGEVLSTNHRSAWLKLQLFRWPVTGFAWLLSLLAFMVPIIALFRQAAGGENATGNRLAIELSRAFRLNGSLVADSLLWSLVTGLLTTMFAIGACWLVRRTRWQGALLGFAVLFWILPGPVLGYGVKEAIDHLMGLEEKILPQELRLVRLLLYEWSTPLPVMWVQLLRFFPYALAFVWPMIQRVPRELLEDVRTSGGSRWSEFRWVGWPSLRSSVVTIILVITALSLGELSASKMVQVPGRQTFVQELFNQMHYGVKSTTAALSLVQLSLSGGCALAIGLSFRVVAQGRRPH